MVVGGTVTLTLASRGEEIQFRTRALHQRMADAGLTRLWAAA